MLLLSCQFIMRKKQRFLNLERAQQSSPGFFSML